MQLSPPHGARPAGNSKVCWTETYRRIIFKIVAKVGCTMDRALCAGRHKNDGWLYKIAYLRCLLSDMKTKIILIFSVVAAFAVGFGTGHFQASISWNHKLYDDFYTGNGGDAFVCAGALMDLRGGDKDAGFTLLEQHLDMCLAHVEPLSAQERNAIVAAGIRKARDYRLEYPWHGPPPVIQEAAEKVLSSAK